jgi:ketosteroid isomerase-like protein
MSAATLTTEEVEALVARMDAALVRGDVEAVVATFTPDATVESPMIPKLLGRREGVCRGHDDIRTLVRALAKRGKPWGAHRPPLVRGSTATIEYLKGSSDDVPFSVDVIEIEDGRIRSLRAYVGWRALADGGAT